MMAKQFCKMSLYITCKKSIHKCEKSVPVGSFDNDIITRNLSGDETANVNFLYDVARRIEQPPNKA